MIDWKWQLTLRLAAGFESYDRAEGPLPGLTPGRRECLIRQLVESSRARWYVRYLCSIDLSPQAADPLNDWFNPVKAAIIRHRAGDDDEAFWLIFLLTHFGRHRRAGWKYVGEVYGALGSGEPWSWERVSGDITEFRDWLDEHKDTLSNPSFAHGFGNHRKYESLAGWADTGTGSVVASYVSWVGEPPSHRARFDAAEAEAENDPAMTFDMIYRSMAAVHRFGRLARFDYLAMVGKIGLADVEPGKAYLRGSTGPLKGARLLFQGPESAHLSIGILEEKAVTLGGYLGVTFDVLEDALCNWQKSPSEFKKFQG